MSNTWGALSWGQTNWGTNNAQITLSGISASFSIGAIVATAEIQVGWGGDTWSENEWGELSGSQPLVAGQQLTSNIGTENITIDVSATVTTVGQMAFGIPSVTSGISVDQNVTGQQLSLSLGEEGIALGIQQPVTSTALTTGIGTATVEPTQLIGAGWGRKTWGNLAWGGAYSAIAVGQELTSTINFPATGAFTDVNVDVTGQQLSITYANPSFSVQIDQDIFVLASEDQLDALTTASTVTAHANVLVTGSQASWTIGTMIAGVKTPVDVTGIQATMTLGDFSLIQSTNEPVTGQQLTASLGTSAEIPDQMVGVGGLQLTSSIGSVTAAGTANIDVTGIQLTSSVGSLSITAWQEIDLGVNNVWAPVDLAA